MTFNKVRLLSLWTQANGFVDFCCAQACCKAFPLYLFHMKEMRFYGIIFVYVKGFIATALKKQMQYNFLFNGKKDEIYGKLGTASY